MYNFTVVPKHCKKLTVHNVNRLIDIFHTVVRHWRTETASKPEKSGRNRMYVKGKSSEKILEENPVLARTDLAMLTMISSVEEATSTEMEITKE
jgi:hypothetical protein